MITITTKNYEFTYEDDFEVYFDDEYWVEVRKKKGNSLKLPENQKEGVLIPRCLIESIEFDEK